MRMVIWFSLSISQFGPSREAVCLQFCLPFFLLEASCFTSFPFVAFDTAFLALTSCKSTYPLGSSQNSFSLRKTDVYFFFPFSPEIANFNPRSIIDVACPAEAIGPFSSPPPLSFLCLGQVRRSFLCPLQTGLFTIFWLRKVSL